MPGSAISSTSTRPSRLGASVSISSHEVVTSYTHVLRTTARDPKRVPRRSPGWPRRAASDQAFVVRLDAVLRVDVDVGGRLDRTLTGFGTAARRGVTGRALGV